MYFVFFQVGSSNQGEKHLFSPKALCSQKSNHFRFPSCISVDWRPQIVRIYYIGGPWVDFELRNSFFSSFKIFMQSTLKPGCFS